VCSKNARYVDACNHCKMKRKTNVEFVAKDDHDDDDDDGMMMILVNPLYQGSIDSLHLPSLHS